MLASIVGVDHLAATPIGDEPKPGEVRKFEIAQSVFMEFCWIPPGEAQLGSPKSERDEVLKLIKENTEPDWLASEAETRRPKFKTQGFWLAKYTVTQAEWKAVMGNNPSYFQLVENGNEAKGLEYGNVSRLNKSRGMIHSNPSSVARSSWRRSTSAMGSRRCSGKVHPSSCRTRTSGNMRVGVGVGNKRPFYFGNVLNGTQANCDGNYPYGTTRRDSIWSGPARSISRTAGSTRSTRGVFATWRAMCAQWCENKYDDEGSDRVVRGGCWGDHARLCRSAYRFGDSPWVRDDYLGFRVALVPSGPLAGQVRRAGRPQRRRSRSGV